MLIKEGFDFDGDDMILRPFFRMGLNPNSAMVRSDASIDFTRNVMAASVAAEHEVTIKCVLRALRKEMADFYPTKDPVSEIKYDAYCFGRSFMMQSLGAWRERPERERKAGEAYSDNAMIHLFSTYNSIAILLKLNHLHEALSLSRDFLEQLALSYSLAEVQSFDQGLQTRPTKAISAVKVLIPEAGILYGLLCDSVHLRVNDHLTFLCDDGMISLTHPKECLLLSLLLPRLSKFWCLIYEYCQKESMDRFFWWQEAPGSFKQAPNTPFEDNLSEIEEMVFCFADDLFMTIPILEDLDSSVPKLIEYLGYDLRDNYSHNASK